MSIDQCARHPTGLGTAFRASGRLHVRFTFLGRERKELSALGTGPDFKVRGSVRIDVGRKEQFIRIVSNGNAVGKLDYGKTVIEDFESGF